MKIFEKDSPPEEAQPDRNDLTNPSWQASQATPPLEAAVVRLLQLLPSFPQIGILQSQKIIPAFLSKLAAAQMIFSDVIGFVDDVVSGWLWMVAVDEDDGRPTVH